MPPGKQDRAKNTHDDAWPTRCHKNISDCSGRVGRAGHGPCRPLHFHPEVVSFPKVFNHKAFKGMLASSFGQTGGAHAQAPDEAFLLLQDDDESERDLRPARGILLGVLLGAISFGALAILAWWALA